MPPVWALKAVSAVNGRRGRDNALCKLTAPPTGVSILTFAEQWSGEKVSNKNVHVRPRATVYNSPSSSLCFKADADGFAMTGLHIDNRPFTERTTILA